MWSDSDYSDNDRCKITCDLFLFMTWLGQYVALQKAESNFKANSTGEIDYLQSLSTVDWLPTVIIDYLQSLTTCSHYHQLVDDNDCSISRSVAPRDIVHLVNNMDHSLNGKDNEDNTKSSQTKKEWNNIIGSKQCCANFFLPLYTWSLYLYMNVSSCKKAGSGTFLKKRPKFF